MDSIDFAKIYIPIILIQSVIVYVGVINKFFRLLIYGLFYFGDDRFETTIQSGTRVGGISLYGADGSLILCTACVLLIYLMMNNKIKSAKFIILYVVITGATAFVGRTGFYLELLFLFAYVIISFKIRTIISVAIVAIVSLFVVNYTLSTLNPEVKEKLTSWIGEIFNQETRYKTVSILLGMKVPPLSGEMLFGTNVTLGITPSGAVMQSDSGYVKTYCAIGIIGAIIYYCSFYFLLSFHVRRIKNTRNKMIFVALVLIAFVIEIKEPFFQKYIFAWFILTLMNLSEKEYRQKVAVAANV